MQFYVRTRNHPNEFMGSLSLKAFDTVSKDIGDVKHEVNIL